MAGRETAYSPRLAGIQINLFPLIASIKCNKVAIIKTFPYFGRRNLIPVIWISSQSRHRSSGEPVTIISANHPAVASKYLFSNFSFQPGTPPKIAARGRCINRTSNWHFHSNISYLEIIYLRNHEK